MIDKIPIPIFSIYFHLDTNINLIKLNYSATKKCKIELICEYVVVVGMSLLVIHECNTLEKKIVAKKSDRIFTE